MKKFLGFLLNYLSKPVLAELIKSQIPKLTDEQKEEILNVTKELLTAAAAGAVQGAASK